MHFLNSEYPRFLIRIPLFSTVCSFYFIMQIGRTVVTFLYIFLPEPMSVRVKNTIICLSFF